MTQLLREPNLSGRNNEVAVTWGSTVEETNFFVITPHNETVILLYDHLGLEYCSVGPIGVKHLTCFATFFSDLFISGPQRTNLFVSLRLTGKARNCFKGPLGANCTKEV